jgi:hypothetical protein
VNALTQALAPGAGGGLLPGADPTPGAPGGEGGGN